LFQGSAGVAAPRASAEPGDLHRNYLVAERFREAAALLAEQAASPFRVRAFRRAADTVDGLGRDVGEILERDGLAGLDALPGIGRGIASAIDELVRTGRWSQLERLRGGAEPEPLFRTIPGVGPVLAQRIHDALHVESLAALEIAAHDGRLAALPGVGTRRATAIAAGLAARLGRARGVPVRPPAEPSVSLLLEIDREYREQAERLPRIAPRRFNPTGERWLPVLHAERDGWHFTALYSNTALAHRLGRTRDWVVVYFHADHAPEGRRTMVTETRGPLAGRRVVRGREVECAGTTPPTSARRRRRESRRSVPPAPRPLSGRAAGGTAAPPRAP
jgi:putative hydrolase